MNGNFIGESYAPSANYNLPLVATLNLKKGETIDTYLVGGSIFDGVGDFRTQFSGILLEEDLVFSN